MDELVKQIIEKIPRKMSFGFVMMWVITEYAKTLTLDLKGQVLVLACLTLIAIESIGCHFYLELKHPTDPGEK